MNSVLSFHYDIDISWIKQNMVQKVVHSCIDDNLHRKYDKQCIICATLEFVFKFWVYFDRRKAADLSDK